MSRPKKSRRYALQISSAVLCYSEESIQDIKGPADSRPIIVPITLNEKVKTLAVADSFATGSFIDHDFAQSHGFTFIPLVNPRRLSAFDGESATTAASHVTHEVQVSVRTGDHHYETTKFFITRLVSALVIFGIL